MPKQKDLIQIVEKNVDRPKEVKISFERTFEPEVHSETHTIEHMRKIIANIDKEIDGYQKKIDMLDAKKAAWNDFINQAIAAGVEE